MNKKKAIRIVLVLTLVGILGGGGIGYYLYMMPHRDITKSEVDYSVGASELVTEFLSDYSEANEKYLAADGDSKILEVTGQVAKVYKNMDEQWVAVLKNEQDQAGVSCSFYSELELDEQKLHEGNQIKVKGVIRSGASYDDDLGFYEHVIIEKCILVL